MGKPADRLLADLQAEGYDIDISDAVINVPATLRLLKKHGEDIRRLSLPKGILGQRRKLAEVCQRRGIAPIYE